MIDRYSREVMRGFWAQPARIGRWLAVEVAHLEAMVAEGLAPAAALDAVRARARVDVARIAEIEKTSQHDVIAFLTSVEEIVGDGANFVHLGLTSSDVIDTAFAIELRDAGQMILAGLADLGEALKERAEEHRRTVCIGRTHGIHAEPTTFGLVLIGHFAEMRRQAKRLETAIEDVSFGKMSGAVGTFSALPVAVEARAMAKLGLKPEPVATQVVPRDRHAAYFAALAGLASSLERLATNLRHLQRTEVLEAEEPFEAGQKGSSAMPHKRNPVGLENLCGLARLVRSAVIPALENVALWHERDISHSSVERVIAPDVTTLLDFMLTRATKIVRGLVVYPENMKRNLEKLGGLSFSSAVLVALAKKGVARQTAYGWVQRCAMRAWKGEDFRTLLENDSDIAAILTNGEVDACFNLEKTLGAVESIFERALAVR